MSRLKMTLSYDGTRYHGWQIQNNAVTVQETLQHALSVLYQAPVTVQGCSRTDAGVHAREFVCHYDSPFFIPEEKLPLALNALLPGDISVLACQAVPNDFHARFSCRGKTYCYRLWNARLRNAFEEHRAGFIPVPLSAERMHRMAQDYVGEHDFAAFMATGATVEDTVRTIFDFSVERKGDLIEFTVTGDGFLYNMVRIMVGTLISADQGKLEHTIPEILSRKDRTLAGITVVPQGLYLQRVYY